MSSTPLSPSARRLRQPRWLDVRLVVGVVLVVGSVLLGAFIVSRAGRTYATVAASRDLAAGTVLTAADVHLAQVQLPDRGAGVYLSSPEQVIGKRLQRPVTHDELVPASAVARVRAQTTLTIPLGAAAAPQLHTGQRIEVWLSAPGCPSVVLLPEVVVQSVRSDDSGSFDTSSGGQDVVVDVDPGLAGRVVQALALDQSQLRAGVLVGGSQLPSAARPSAPDLSACGSASPTG